MLPMNMVELFCGSGNVTRTFKEAGYETFSVDIRCRKGICEPSLKKDIIQLQRQEIVEALDSPAVMPGLLQYVKGPDPLGINA